MCILPGSVRLDLGIGGGLVGNGEEVIGVESVQKLCVHTVNKQTNNDIPFFFNLLLFSTRLHPPTKIPVLNDQLLQFLNGTHDVIQVALFHVACCKKSYTCILLT